MRKSAKNRIIAWSIVSVLLVGVLIAGIFIAKKGDMGLINTTPVSLGSSDISNSIDIADEITVFETNTIDNLSVSWSSGNVKVEVAKTDKITVTVKPYLKKNNNDVVHYVNANGTLGIYSEKQSGWNLFDSFSSKDVVITVPADKRFDNIEISTASAEASIDGVKATDINTNTASGDTIVTNSQGDAVSMNSASGNVSVLNSEFTEIDTNVVSGKTEIDGKFKDFDSESVSGSVTINSLTECEKIDSETVSGSVYITLPKSVNAVNVDFDSVSGSLNSEFGTSTSANAPHIKLDTVSGSATVKKAA